jgi:hypothetical protein
VLILFLTVSFMLVKLIRHGAKIDPYETLGNA